MSHILEGPRKFTVLRSECIKVKLYVFSNILLHECKNEIIKEDRFELFSALFENNIGIFYSSGFYDILNVLHYL